MALIEARQATFRAQVEPVLGDDGPSLAFTAQRAVVDGLGVRVLHRRGEPVAKPAAQLDLTGLPGRIAVRGLVNISRGTAGTRVGRPGRKSVGKEFLPGASPFDAEIRRRHDQRAGQIPLNRRLPGVGVSNLEIRIDGKCVGGHPRTAVEPVGQSERIGGAVLHAQTLG